MNRPPTDPAERIALLADIGDAVGPSRKTPPMKRSLDGPSFPDITPPSHYRALEWQRREDEARRREALTYRQGGEYDWLTHLTKVTLNQDMDKRAEFTLAVHAGEVATRPEYAKHRRSVSTASGSASNAVPPAWLEADFIPAARPGRATADTVVNAVLPGGTNNLNIPKLSTGSTAATGAENTEPSDNSADYVDAVVSCKVQTASGELWGSQALLDQAGDNFTEVIYRDLRDAVDTAVDKQVLNGSGPGTNELQGVIGAAGVNQVYCSENSAQAFQDAGAAARGAIWTNRDKDAEVVVMHPSRFVWYQATADQQGRPLFLPRSPGIGSNPVVANVARSAVVGEWLGLPIVLDPSVPTTGSNASGDYVIMMRASDLILWESGPLARVLTQTQANTLTIGWQLRQYVAFGIKFPTSVSIISLPAIPPPGS